VAFTRGASTGADIYIAGLDAQRNVTGSPQRVTTTNHAIFGIAWTQDGAALIAGSGTPATPPDLWRIGVSPPSAPELLPFGRRGGASVAIAAAGTRLAYSRVFNSANLWRLPLAGPGAARGAPAKFLPSTRLDFNPAYSPDGKRVAFHSSRSGKPGLWVADANGANAAELFVPQEGHAGSPSWSPDGQLVAFDWNGSGRFQIYTIRAAGGKPNRVSDNPAGESGPSWSRDGKWLYFSSGRSGRSEIWKSPASGGDALQVTRNGGFLPIESPDGRFVYHRRTGADTGVWKVAASGGEESEVLAAVYGRNFTVAPEGIYFVPEPGRDGSYTLEFLPFAGGKPKTVVTLPRPPMMGMALSPDGASLLYSQVEQASQELVLVENFK
jgi:Tol biopolymer transport system component